MKKLVVLSVLLALMVMPAFASDVTFGGDATYGFISDFSGDATAFGEKQDLTLDMTAVVDEINTVKVSFDNWETAVDLDKAVIVHDLGVWLDLPVGAVLTVGYDDPGNNMYQSISTGGNEEINDFALDNYWGFNLLVSVDPVEVQLAMAPGSVGDGDHGYLLIGLAVPDLQGVSAEVYWSQGGGAIDTYDAGMIGIDAAYSTEIAGIALDAGIGFMYNMDDLALAGEEWKYGVGLAASYDMFGVDFGLDGNDNDTLSYLTANVSVSPVELADFYAYFEMALYDGAVETFQGLEIGADVHVGAADMYVGYWMNNDAFGGNNAPGYPDPTVAEGGIFVKWDINY